MAVLGEFLMVATPAGPGCDLVWGADGCPEEPHEQPADLRDRDRDVGRTGRPPFLRAPTVSTAKARSARVMGRYQPCHLRTS